MHTSVVRRMAAAVLTVTVAVGAAACGEEQAAAPAPGRTAPNGDVFNAADARFATDLLKQRAEEFALIDLTVGRTVSDDLSLFLDQAREVRAAEVDTTTTWLTDWGKPVPSTVRDHAAGHAGVHAFPEVEEATDTDFQKLWISTFLDELEESDRIAEAEEDEGTNDEALDLAEAVDTTNADESDALEDLLG